MERPALAAPPSGDQGLLRAVTDLPLPAPVSVSIASSGAATLAKQGRSFTSVALSVGQGAMALKRDASKAGTVKVTVRMKSGRRAIKPRTPTAETRPVSSQTYDSNYDSDENEYRAQPPKGRTSTDFMLDICKQVYAKSCQKLKIVPRNHFLKQLGQKNMNLRNEGLSRKELNAICASLVGFAKLFTIDLSGNQLTDRCMSYVCQLLQRNDFITELTLSECEITTEGLQDLVSVIPMVSTLEKLNLSGNKFRDEAGKTLSKLISMTELSHLVLSHNELREDGGVWIGDALAKNECLENLDLSWNHLRGKGAECLALSLLKNKTLTTLNISWNGFGFEGCCALGHSLHENTTLRELDLTCNRIHPPALYELLKGALCNRGLTCLRMARNPIPAGMTSAILAKFRDATEMRLTTLDFTGIVVDKLFEVVLQEIQESRPHFRCIYERSLPVHKEKWEDLDKLQKGVLNIDPMRILFFIKKNLRIIDLFRQMDSDHSATISRSEIRMALLKEDLPVSSSSLDAIMAYLDTNNDGEIDLMELADGERRFKRETIAERQHWESQERMNIEHAQKEGLPADLGGAGGRFSRSFRPDLTDLRGQSLEMKDPNNERRNRGKPTEESTSLRLPNINERPGNITDRPNGSASQQVASDKERERTDGSQTSRV